MDPRQIIEQTETDENRGVSKSAHTKNPTTCPDTRRSGDACGICGSYNVVNQGVRYCVTCGLEVESLQASAHFWWDKDTLEPICNCPLVEKASNYIKNRTYKESPRNSYHVEKCLDCGAVNSARLCPNCGPVRSDTFSVGAWQHWDGRMKCAGCGFTIDNPIACAVGANPAGKKAQGKQGTKKAKQAAMKHMSRRKQKRLEAKNRPHPNKIG